MSGELPLGLPLGLHPDVPHSLYHKRELGVISKSALDACRTGAHYKCWLAEPDKDTAALGFGRAFHTASLEPQRYAEEYAVEPDHGDCRYKDNKRKRDEWREQHAGCVLIGEEDFVRITAMQAAVRTHPIAGPLLQGGEPELTITWQDAETGLYGKSRADYYIESRGVVVDLKTTRDASIDEFAKSCARYRYHVQDALYRFALASAGKPVEHFVIVAVEKEPPYAVAVHTLDTDGIARGYTAARQDIDRLADWVKRDEWIAYPPHITTIELPRWA